MKTWHFWHLYIKKSMIHIDASSSSVAPQGLFGFCLLIGTFFDNEDSSHYFQHLLQSFIRAILGSHQVPSCAPHHTGLREPVEYPWPLGYRPDASDWATAPGGGPRLSPRGNVSSPHNPVCARLPKRKRLVVSCGCIYSLLSVTESVSY